MKPEEFLAKVKKACPTGLMSVTLYGSAAAGDHAGKHSDYNILIVMKDLGLDVLKTLSEPTRGWVKAGNPPPLLFTLDRLKQSADVFPIELLDMKECHAVLYGDDVLEEIEVRRENLRWEIEHELRGKLIQLREHYLLTRNKPRPLLDLMVESLSTFLVLFRAALRLYQDEVPPRKLEALRVLSEHVTFDKGVFETISELKSGGIKAKEVEAEGLISRYLRTVESVIDAVDAHIHGKKEGD